MTTEDGEVSGLVGVATKASEKEVRRSKLDDREV
jgi:hypothetical protein